MLRALLLRFGTLLVAVAPILAVASSCHDYPTCYAGDFRACTCNEGGASTSGFQACLPSGDGFAACACNGAVPGLDASAIPDAAPDADDSGGKLPFMSPCQNDAQCETGLCFPFNAKGPHCSKTCAHDSDCPPPADGCSNMGICKVP